MENDFNQSKKGLSIASLVLGIIGMLTSCMFVGIVCGVLAIIFGAVALNKKEGIKGMAIAGLILGIISVGLTILVLLGIGVSIATVASLLGIQ